MTRVRLFVPLMLFLLICGVSYVGFSLNDRHQLPSALLDKPFPEFSAASLLQQNRRISKADFLGSPTLVNVWATWCPTCKSEHDELLRIAAGSDIQMVGVNYKDDIGLAQNWLAQFGNPYDLVVVDADGALGVELGVYGAPETFLLDSNGRVVFKRVGDINPRIWRDELQPRFAELGVRVDQTLLSGL